MKKSIKILLILVMLILALNLSVFAVSFEGIETGRDTGEAQTLTPDSSSSGVTDITTEKKNEKKPQVTESTPTVSDTTSTSTSTTTTTTTSTATEDKTNVVRDKEIAKDKQLPETGADVTLVYVILALVVVSAFAYFKVVKYNID